MKTQIEFTKDNITCIAEVEISTTLKVTNLIVCGSRWVSEETTAMLMQEAIDQVKKI